MSLSGQRKREKKEKADVYQTWSEESINGSGEVRKLKETTRKSIEKSVWMSGEGTRANKRLN